MLWVPFLSVFHWSSNIGIVSSPLSTVIPVFFGLSRILWFVFSPSTRSVLFGRLSSLSLCGVFPRALARFGDLSSFDVL